MKKILVIDDEKNHRLMLKLNLEEEGYEVIEVDNGIDGLELMTDEKFFAVLLDIKMDMMDGITVLYKMKQNKIETPVIMVTAFNSVRTAVETIKLGAFDFITKPVDVQLLVKTLKKIEPSSEKPVFLKETHAEQDFIFEGVYSENGIGKIVPLLKMVAPTDATVMIYGESGTGKELIAKAVHNNSKRKSENFLAVNCAALNENLIETELFGHEKGAFTGAAAQKKGKFELAENGTIFLDEIGEMPLSTQAKLLRVLQEKSFERVGGIKTLTANVRVVAATNRILEEMVKNGTFREDLFFRLNVFPIHLPSLRERKDELPLLVDFFIQKYAESFGKIIKGCSASFLSKLERYSFPGNIRELENIIERSIILTTGEKLSEESLPNLNSNIKNEILTLDVRENERKLIIKALEESRGNKSNAAKVLGISRKTLYDKIREYSIEV